MHPDGCSSKDSERDASLSCRVYDAHYLSTEIGKGLEFARSWYAPSWKSMLRTVGGTTGSGAYIEQAGGADSSRFDAGIESLGLSESAQFQQLVLWLGRRVLAHFVVCNRFRSSRMGCLLHKPVAHGIFANVLIRGGGAKCTRSGEVRKIQSLLQHILHVPVNASQLRHHLVILSRQKRSTCQRNFRDLWLHLMCSCSSKPNLAGDS